MADRHVRRVQRRCVLGMLTLPPGCHLDGTVDKSKERARAKDAAGDTDQHVQPGQGLRGTEGPPGPLAGPPPPCCSLELSPQQVRLGRAPMHQLPMHQQA